MFVRTHQQCWKLLRSIHQKRHTSSSQTNIIFGANTDVGKTVITTGLIRASGNSAHYVKPLQCGGSDQRFVEKHATNVTSATTLFEWETPASPHYAARVEDKPISDQQVISSLSDCLESLEDGPMTWVETAGGVMSPSSSSPDNNGPHHARDQELSWGWVPQADLYQVFSDSMSAVLIGDGRLGGISATLTALESLLIRGYDVSGVIVIEKGYENQKAIQEYVGREVDGQKAGAIFRYPESAIVSLPELPPEPEPLNDWYRSDEVTSTLESFVQGHLQKAWEDRRSAN